MKGAVLVGGVVTQPLSVVSHVSIETGPKIASPLVLGPLGSPHQLSSAATVWVWALVMPESWLRRKLLPLITGWAPFFV